MKRVAHLEGCISLARRLSPFFLGPVALYDGHVAKNVENAWQYSKARLPCPVFIVHRV